MPLARTLVELEASLAATVDLFSPASLDQLQTIPEFSATLPRLDSIVANGSAAIMRLCLQALRIQQENLAPRLIDAELVATLPPDMPGIARPTEQVLREMIGRSTKEIILLGYELSDADFIRQLADASSRGTKVVVICDRARGVRERVIHIWPSEIHPPDIFEDCDRPGSAPFASMHAKCLLVDGKDLLITSANFTFHGLRGNIEIGVRLGGPLAGEARKIFSHLVTAGIVKEAS